jgi:hypothetical protein
MLPRPILHDLGLAAIMRLAAVFGVCRGQQVTAYKWEHSDHVSHLKLHRQQYLAMLLPFLQSLPGAAPQSRL